MAIVAFDAFKINYMLRDRFMKKYDGVVWWLTAGIFFVGLAIFLGILFGKVGSDIQAHAFFVRDMVIRWTLPPVHFFYFVLVAALSLFSHDLKVIFVVSAFVLAFALAAKFWVSQNFLFAFVGKENLEKFLKKGKRALWRVLLAVVALMFVQSLPFFPERFPKILFLGQFPPNVWHNSTMIFLMPFAVLLFWESYKFLNKPSNKSLILMAVWMILGILIKPSFFMVFILVFPFFALYKLGFSRWLWLAALMCFSGLVIFLGQYYWVYVYRPYMAGVGITINFFHLWSWYSDNVFLSWVGSAAFPLAVFGFYFSEYRKNLMYYYALSFYMVGLLILVAVTELGESQYAGNFTWQYMICNYVFYLVALTLYVKSLLKRGKFVWKDWVIFVIGISHFVVGVLYLFKTFLLKNIA